MSSFIMWKKSLEKEFTKFYEKYADALFKHCYFRLFDRGVAFECMQDVFLSIWEYMRAGNEIRNFKAFLYRTANNRIVDYVRKKKDVLFEHTKEGELSVGFVDTQKEFVLKNKIDTAFLLEKMHDILDSREYTVLVMRYMDGLKPREIAKILDETPNVVSIRIHRAIKKVEALYEKSTKNF